MLTGKPIITTGVYKTKKSTSSTSSTASRPYQKLNRPETSVLDGHPEVKYGREYSAASVYPTTIHGNVYKDEQLYKDLERMDILVAQFVGKIAINTDNWDWGRVTIERGKHAYTIDEMKEKIQQHGMIPPSNAKRVDLVNFLIENKSRFK
jgi:hypothetical protein